MISLRSLFKEEYWGNSGAGALIIAKDTGRILMVLRSQEVNEEGTWGLISGKIDQGEAPKEAVQREVKEEVGYDGSARIYPLYTYQDAEHDFTFYNFLFLVPEEFKPLLNWENDEFEWVEWGDWPQPMHFGAEKLFGHDKDKIKKIVDIIKKIGHTALKEDMVAHQIATAQSFSPEFTAYIKSVENPDRVGFKDGKWFPHTSPEGGNPTIAYGHKLKDIELNQYKRGISASDAERLLTQDLIDARQKVYSDIKAMFGIQVPLDSKQEEMLIDYEFNIGTIKGYPKLVRAIIDKDWNTTRKEYKRTYKDKHGKRHELSRRDQAYFNRYLK